MEFKCPHCDYSMDTAHCYQKPESRIGVGNVQSWVGVCQQCLKCFTFFYLGMKLTTQKMTDDALRDLSQSAFEHLLNIRRSVLTIRCR